MIERDNVEIVGDADGSLRSEAVLTYRYRHRPLVRFWSELITGSFFIPAILVWPGFDRLLSAEGIVCLFFFWIAALFGVKRRRRTSTAVKLTRDHVVFRDRWGRTKTVERHEVGIPRPNEGDYGVSFPTPKGPLKITPEITRYEDLRRRLEVPDLGVNLPSRRAVAWSGPTSFRYSGLTFWAVLYLLGAAFFFWMGASYLFSQFADAVELGAYSCVIAGALLGLGIQRALCARLETVTIAEGRIRWRKWWGRVQLDAPIEAILGAHRREHEYSRVGVIDTEYGEIRFSSKMRDYALLVKAAQAVADSRYDGAISTLREASRDETIRPISNRQKA